MIRAKRPKIRKVGIDVGCSPDILKPVLFSDTTTLVFILGEDDDVGILVCKVFIRSMTLNELVYGNLASIGPWKMYIGTEGTAEFGDAVRFPFPASVGEEDIRNFLLFESFQCSCSCSNGF